MFQKFGQGLPQSLIDAVSGIMSEAKADEPAAPDADAIARRKRLQALKDKAEDDAAENSYKKDTSVRKVAGSAYGGAKQKDDIEEELKGNQHKIDANKNGKLDAHDFKLLRTKKKVEEALEEGQGHTAISKLKRGVNVFNKNLSKARKSGEISGEVSTNLKNQLVKRKDQLTTKDLPKKEVDEGYDARGAYEKHDPKHPDFVKNHKKWKATNPSGSLSDFIGHMKKANPVREEVEELSLEDYSLEEIQDFMMSEDFEQLDELSKKTLGSYVKKQQGLAEAGNKPVDKQFPIGTGDTRTARELKTQMQGASDEFVKHSAKDVGPFHSRVAKMQGKLAKSELRKRGQGLAEADNPNAKLGDFVNHMKKQNPVREALVKDKKTGKLYDPDKQFNKLMKDPKTIAQLKRMKNNEPAPKNEEVLDEKSTSEKQARTMAAAAHNPEFAKKVGIPTKVAKDFNQADKGSKLLSRAMKEDSELHLDLSEGKYDDLPFEPDEKPKQSAVAGKKGYGVSVSRHLARMGMKKVLDTHKKTKTETMMGTAGATSEETVDERVITPGTGTSPDPLKARIGLSRSLKKPEEKAKANQQLKTAIKSTVDNSEHGKSNLPEETVDESRGHKILATKLKQIDMMSSGKAPDFSVNVQSTKDKLKDAKNLSKVEIVNQKDTCVEETELDEVSAGLIGRYFDKANKEYNDPKTSDKKKASRFAGLKLSYNKAKGRANVPATYDEETQIDELSKNTLGSYIKKAADPSSEKSNVNLSSRAASKLASGEGDEGESDDKKAFQRSKGIQRAAGKLATEETLDETASLDQYIKSMGYDPKNMEKNKKVMFSKTNAFKTWASSRNEAMYDGGQKGTQDIEAGMSPGATARG
jgi:hypothetical protein